jgi:hypothetical protein
MEGWEAVTSNDEKVGRVAGVKGRYLIVEHGHVRKTRHVVPQSFAHPREADEQVCLNVSKSMLMDAPKVDGDDDFDEDEADRHYGLAESMPGSPTEGDGELDPDDPAWTAEQDAAAAGLLPTDRLRAQVREHKRSNRAPRSSSFLGERPRPRR